MRMENYILPKSEAKKFNKQDGNRMRALFISLLSLTILVVSWSIFLVYAGNAINDMVDILEYETIEKIKMKMAKCPEII